VRRIGLGIGLIATVLLPFALLFFGLLKGNQTISAVLLLSGLWTFAFGLFMEKRNERLYYSGFGVIVAILSTFLFIQFRYTIGLILIAFVVLAMVSVFYRPGARASPQKA